jgi:nitrogen fixation-related uncharacterized protein
MNEILILYGLEIVALCVCGAGVFWALWAMWRMWR